MKQKCNRILAVFLTLLLVAGSSGSGLVAIAAEASPTQETETDITLLPGDLMITETPDFSFLFSREELKDGPSTDTGAIQGQLQILDGRGAFTSWTLTASLGQFVTRGYPQRSLNRPVLSLEAPVFTSAEVSGTSFSGYPVELISGDPTFHTIAVAPTTVPGGAWTGTFPAARLTVRDREPSTGSTNPYEAEVYWSIQDTP